MLLMPKQKNKQLCLVTTIISSLTMVDTSCQSGNSKKIGKFDNNLHMLRLFTSYHVFEYTDTRNFGK